MAELLWAEQGDFCWRLTYRTKKAKTVTLEGSEAEVMENVIILRISRLFAETGCGYPSSAKVF